MPERTCSGCGCTDVRACVVDGIACHWVGPETCSACADKGEGGAITMGVPNVSVTNTVTEARITDVSLMPDGLIETTIEGVLDDGRAFTGVWPGEYSIEPKEESDGAGPLPERP